jgi:maltose O-acetyltransferase
MKNLFIKFISFLVLAYYKYLRGFNLKLGKNIICNHKLVIKGKGLIVIHDNVNLWAHNEKTRLETYSKKALIKIGKNTRINGVVIQSRKKVIIRKDCIIGSANIMDNDFHHLDPKKRRQTKNIPTKPVIINKNVWIAGQAAVLKGVTIKENSVVGFRAVVTKDVPKNVVVNQLPCKISKSFQP